MGKSKGYDWMSIKVKRNICSVKNYPDIFPEKISDEKLRNRVKASSYRDKDFNGEMMDDTTTTQSGVTQNIFIGSDYEINSDGRNFGR